ncbi:hypothetical protein KC19_5G099000 [Ceratodon purpureus]|uniref:Uncharacterized protein n=1 Tax=Ceratodon purpureus TaxID=3225 RepID=A0A8T0I271_CERPU|nr:hypothetical protein KC19_5G099000 [Ceratodon purpureus]
MHGSVCGVDLAFFCSLFWPHCLMHHPFVLIVEINLGLLSLPRVCDTSYGQDIVKLGCLCLYLHVRMAA